MKHFNLGEHSHLREHADSMLRMISKEGTGLRFTYSERDAARSILAERQTLSN